MKFAKHGREILETEVKVQNSSNLSIVIMSSVIIYYIVYFFNLLGLTEKTSLTLSISAPLIVLILFCSILLVRINEK